MNALNKELKKEISKLRKILYTKKIDHAVAVHDGNRQLWVDLEKDINHIEATLSAHEIALCHSEASKF